MKPEQFIKEIAQEIVSGRCVPFIGAGFSALAEYPTWKDLLNQIIIEDQKFSKRPSDLKNIDTYLKSNKLQEAANFLSSQVEDCKSLVCGIIRSHEQRESATSRIKKSIDLRKWDCKTFITTNYDHLIESLLEDSDSKYVSIRSIEPNTPTRLLSRENKIIHLHGEHDYPTSIVFSESDITQMIRDNNITTRYLESLMLHDTLFFFGYSINEPHIRPLLYSLEKMRAEADHYHYAILGINSQESTSFEEAHRLRILELNPDNNYKDTRGQNLLKILGEITAECLKLQNAKNEKIARDYNHDIHSKYDREIKDTIGKISKLADLQKIHVPVKALMTVIVEKGLEIINDKNKTFTIHVVEGDKMRIIAEGGADALKARKSESRNRDKNQGLIGRVYRDNLPFYCPNVALMPPGEYYEGNPLTKSEFVVPLRDEGNVFGVLNIESTEKNDFDFPKDQAILQAVAQQVSISLRNKKKYDLKEFSLAVCRKTYVENEIEGRLHSGIDPLVKLFTKTLRNAIDHDSTDKNRLIIRGGIIKTPIATDSHRKDSIIAVAPGDFNKEEIINNVQDDISDIERAIIHETSAQNTNKNNLYHYICDDLLCHYVLYLNSNYSLILDEDLSEGLQICVTHIGDNLRYLNKTREQDELIRELNLVKKLIHLSETESDENKLLHAVSINVCLELEVDWCFIYTYNPVAGYGSEDPLRYDMKTVNFISGGVTLDEFEKKSYSPGDGLTGLVLEEEDFVTSEDVFTDNRSSKKNTLPFKSRGIEVSAFLGYPIRFEKPLIPENKTASKLTQTIGIITLGRKEKFGRKEKETIKIISTFIGKELERRRLIFQQELFHNYTTLLNLLPEKLATCGTEELVLKAVDEFVPMYLKEQYYSIFRLEADRTLEMKSPEKYVENMDIHPPTFCIDEPEGLTNKIIRDGKPIFRLNFDQGKEECRNFWSRIVGTDDRYFIGVPIKHPMNENEYYGVFTLNGRKPATFDPHFCESVTVEVVKSVASQISFALSRTHHVCP